MSLQVERRRCRAEGDRRLKSWGHLRPTMTNEMGWPSESIEGRIRRDGIFGAGQRGGDPARKLTMPEIKADQFNRVLTIENLVFSMPEEWRIVVISYYVSKISVVRLAIEMQIERDRLMYRLHDAQERVGASVRGIRELTEAERELLARLWDKKKMAA